MHITSIIENTSCVGLPVEHGLSLYLQLTDGRRVLFDMGQSPLFAQNAERLGLSIQEIDVAIISHGHYDHGGGLRRFLELNHHANVYLHRDAFQHHYSMKESGLRFIGLDASLKENEQLVLCGDKTEIDATMLLFADVHGNCCNPLGNKLLFGPLQKANDDFHHEQNLLVKDGNNTILLAGCAHRGIVNILQKATEILGHAPTHVFSGMHLVKSDLDEQEEAAFIHELSTHLMQYKDTVYYTMHCTGTQQFQQLKTCMGEQIHYLSCGEQVIIDKSIN